MYKTRHFSFNSCVPLRSTGWWMMMRWWWPAAAAVKLQAARRQRVQRPFRPQTTALPFTGISGPNRAHYRVKSKAICFDERRLWTIWTRMRDTRESVAIITTLSAKVSQRYALMQNAKIRPKADSITLWRREYCEFACNANYGRIKNINCINLLASIMTSEQSND